VALRGRRAPPAKNSRAPVDCGGGARRLSSSWSDSIGLLRPDHKNALAWAVTMRTITSSLVLAAAGLNAIALSTNRSI